MTERPSAIERAFELAKSPRCRTMADVRQRLKEEGFSAETVAGSSLTKQLTAILKARREES